MHDRGKNRAARGKQSRHKEPDADIFDLKPNEAYEPGFGKYTLTRSELRAGETNRLKVEQLGGHTVKSTNVTTAKTDHAQPGSKGATMHHHESGASHYTNAPGRREEDRKMREENTNMHNNW